MTDETTGSGRALEASARPDWKFDVIPGAVAIVLGALVLPYARSMPVLGDGRPGPGLFPTIIAGLLIIFGAGLIIKALIRHRRAAVKDPAEQGLVDAEAPQETLPPLQRWLNPLGILAAIAFYIFLAETIGFIITMFLVVAAIMLMLRARVLTAVLTAAAVTALLFSVFQLLLLVQLPRGILSGVL